MSEISIKSCKKKARCGCSLSNVNQVHEALWVSGFTKKIIVLYYWKDIFLTEFTIGISKGIFVSVVSDHEFFLRNSSCIICKPSELGSYGGESSCLDVHQCENRGKVIIFLMECQAYHVALFLKNIPLFSSSNMEHRFLGLCLVSSSHWKSEKRSEYLLLIT